jgi:hypothetical protein
MGVCLRSCAGAQASANKVALSIDCDSVEKPDGKMAMGRDFAGSRSGGTNRREQREGREARLCGGSPRAAVTLSKPDSLTRFDFPLRLSAPVPLFPSLEGPQGNRRFTFADQKASQIVDESPAAFQRFGISVPVLKTLNEHGRTALMTHGQRSARRRMAIAGLISIYLRF